LICQYHKLQIGAARLDETMHAEAPRPICKQYANNTQITLKENSMPCQKNVIRQKNVFRLKAAA
jgi:hypothetical protein